MMKRNSFLLSIPLVFALAVAGPSAHGQDIPAKTAKDAQASFEEALRELSKTGNPFARKALELREQMEKANARDLAYLRRELVSCFPPGCAIMSRQEFLEKLAAKLRSDKEVYTKIKQALDTKTGADRGSPELRTSLVKLVGTAQLSGLLDDAAALLSAQDDRRRNILDRDPSEVKPRHNEVAVLKILFLYAILTAKDEPNLTNRAEETDKNVQMLYPAPLPCHLDLELLKCAGLACRDSQGVSHLKVPNAGFIYGGTFVNGACRGVDCSAFLSHCANSAKRLSTMVMEYAWRELARGEGSFDEKEKLIRQEFLEKWGLKEALEEFEAVDLSATAKPQPGDIVVWRWNKPGGGRDGHATMYLIPLQDAEGEFYGIEANREDDKSLEGIIVRRLKLKRENADTYVLRRKDPAKQTAPQTGR